MTADATDGPYAPRGYHASRLEPELAALVPTLPVLDLDDMDAVRETVNAALPSVEERDAARASRGVHVSDTVVPAGTHDIPIRIYRGRAATADERPPVVVYFHGGGFVAGVLDHAESWCVEAVAATGATVVSVDYRLAPEHRYPAGPDDAWAALEWVFAQGEWLGVDLGRVVVGGVSAGGCLAAAVCLRARDAGLPLAGQLLQYPVLDSDLKTPSMLAFEDTPGWDARNSRLMWGHYLGPEPTAAADASPAHAVDLTGLPPTYVLTCEFDPLRDEALEYALRALASDVSVELHQSAGTIHGFDNFTDVSEVARKVVADQHRFLRLRFAAS